MDVCGLALQYTNKGTSFNDEHKWSSSVMGNFSGKKTVVSTAGKLLCSYPTDYENDR